MEILKSQICDIHSVFHLNSLICQLCLRRLRPALLLSGIASKVSMSLTFLL